MREVEHGRKGCRYSGAARSQPRAGYRTRNVPGSQPRRGPCGPVVRKGHGCPAGGGSGFQQLRRSRGGACFQLFNSVFGAHIPKFLERGVASSAYTGVFRGRFLPVTGASSSRENSKPWWSRLPQGRPSRSQSTVRLRRILGNAGDNVRVSPGSHSRDDCVPAGEHSSRHSTRSVLPSAERSPAVAEKCALICLISRSCSMCDHRVCGTERNHAHHNSSEEATSREHVSCHGGVVSAFFMALLLSGAAAGTLLTTS